MEVLVIGAGVAGLAASQTLSSAGVKVTILEARDRIGGRIFTLRDPRFAIPIELGAEFIHGRSDQIFSIVHAAGLSISEVKGTHQYAHGGKLSDGRQVFSEIDQIFDRMRDSALPDQVFSQFLDTIEADSGARLLAKAYMEGFNAARADEISVRALATEMQAGDAIDGDHAFRVRDGYDRISEWLWRACNPALSTLRLETAAATVRWKRGQVEVTAHMPADDSWHSFAADCAIITVPLGVLQAPEDAPGAIRFVPPLNELRSALGRLVMGQAVRITLVFRRSFWDQEPRLRRTGFIHSSEKWFPTWWTAVSPDFPALTGWAGGPKAEVLGGLSDRTLTARAIESISHILGAGSQSVEDQVESYCMHNWCADPFTRGAYSYSCVGGLEARHVLATPIEDTIFFAGEAVGTEGYGGTVHGAISTGKRAARAIITRADSRA